MKFKMQMLLGVAAVVVLALGANLNNYARAEDGEVVTGSDTGGLSVSPSIDKLGYLKPGDTITREVTVVNPGDEDRTFKVLTSSFWVEDENYEVKWGVSDSQFGKIAEWTDIDTTKTHTVAPGETYKFEYRISVPSDQAGGAQRLMVTIALGGVSDGGFIGAETHLNTLVYGNVEGDVHPGAEVVSQSIQGFSFTPSVNTASTLNNTGDVDLDVTYRVTMTDFFNGSEAYSLEEEKVLMTDSTRMYEQKWVDAPFLGVFNVTQEIELMGETYEKTGVTIICPLWLMIAVIVMIVLFVAYVIFKRKSTKRRVKE